MSDIIQEVEESLKQERLEKLWKEQGPTILAGAVLLVLVTAVISFWQSHQYKTHTRETQALLNALSLGDPGQTLIDALPGLDGGRKATALLIVAGTLAQSGKLEDAMTQYKLASEDKTLPVQFRDLATLLEIRTQSAIATPDVATSDAMLARLKPLWSDDRNPWRWHARLQAAEIQAHGLKDFESAHTLLAPLLAESDLPPSLAQRAQALDHIYIMDMHQSAPAGDKDKAGTKEGTEG